MNESKSLSWIQRFFVAIFPRSWAESMEADSRAWMVRCHCGFAQSIWDLGGIRWKASGNPRRYPPLSEVRSTIVAHHLARTTECREGI